MKIRFGFRDMEYPSPELGELRDSRDLLGDVPALRARMQEDGYLLLRGLIDRDKVLQHAAYDIGIHGGPARPDPGHTRAGSRHAAGWAQRADDGA